MNKQVNTREAELALLADEDLDAVSGGTSGAVIRALGEALSTLARKE